jgi:hypothetical protein
MEKTTWLIILCCLLGAGIIALLVFYPQTTVIEKVVIVNQTKTVEVPITVTETVYKYIENTRCNCGKEPSNHTSLVEFQEEHKDLINDGQIRSQPAFRNNTQIRTLR